MSEYLPILIEWIRHYGMALLGAAIILQTNGIPVGANFLVMAAGAFAFAGEFNIYGLCAGVWLFLLLGDASSYFIWKRIGHAAQRRAPAFGASMMRRLSRADALIRKYGPAAITITRFPLSIFSVAVNIISGTTRFKFSRFLLAAAIGEALWAAFNLGFGYWFGDSWEEVSQLASAAGNWVALALLLLLVAYLLYRSLKQRKNT